MRVKRALVLSSIALATIMLFASVGRADVYSGYDHHSLYVIGIKCQEWELWVRINRKLTDLNNDGVVDMWDVVTVCKAYDSTPSSPYWNPIADLDNDGDVDMFDVARVSKDYETEGNTWNIKWKQTGSWPYTALMYCFYLSYLKAWDDKGFSWSWGPHVYPDHGFSGELTLTGGNIYTWTHTEICWCYATTPFTYDYVTCRVDIYVGD